jgi:high-affinity Fe2+/Pb2+ permease
MSAFPESHRRSNGLAVGLVLIVVGLIAFALQRASIDVADWLGGSGWTLFIIVPGLVLLVVAALTREGAAQGFTTAGFIVTAIGLLLLYQDQTGHWESWSYAWAVIPAAAGLSLVVHGLRTRTRELVSTGVTMVAIALGLLLVGGWYFETVFETGRVPFDISEAWPFVVMGIGALVIVAALARRSPKAPASRPATHVEPPTGA